MTESAPATTTRTLGDRERRKALIGTGMGNAIEWYDWNIYVVFSAIFAANFVPDGAAGTGMLQVLLIFAVGFFFRPLGGLVLAAVADRFGRRLGLSLVVALMALGCVLIAAAPTHDQVGFFAPLLLLVARITQGLSAGGEFAAASTYLAEVAPSGKRGLYSSVFYISTALGTITAVLTSLALRSALTEDQLAAWGWRIPFVVGALLGVAALWIRIGLVESEVFTATKTTSKPSLFTGIRHYPKASLQVFGMTAGVTIWYYVFAVYLPVNAKADASSAASRIDVASICSLLLFCVALPLFGRASDRFGRRLWMLVFCGLATVAAVPLLSAATAEVHSVFLIQTIGLLVFAFYGSIAPSLMSEMFPTEVRAAGIGLPYALAVAVFGGTSPYVLEWMVDIGQRDLFAWYVAALCLVSLLVSLTLKDRRDHDLRDLGDVR